MCSAAWCRQLLDVCGSGRDGGGLQQAISSRVPSVVCRGTVTVWLMDSVWFATGSQELWEKKNPEVLSYKVQMHKQNLFLRCIKK